MYRHMRNFDRLMEEPMMMREIAMPKMAMARAPVNKVYKKVAKKEKKIIAPMAPPGADLGGAVAEEKV
jgi:hypothetical protein